MLPRPPFYVFRFAFRAVRLLIHLGLGLLLASALRIDNDRHLSREQVSQGWYRGLIRILGLRVQVQGAPVGGGRVTVSNHVSWLDIPLIGACAGTRFVSKAEVGRWPVAGWLANAGGTFYIQRGKNSKRPLLDRLVPHLRAGGSVTLFPEGTTSAGTDVLPFHPRLFAAAIESGLPVQPVVLRYGPARVGGAVAPFVGDDDLASHVIRLLKASPIEVQVMWLAPVYPQGLDRDALARQVYASVRAHFQPANPVHGLQAAHTANSLAA